MIQILESLWGNRVYSFGTLEPGISEGFSSKWSHDCDNVTVTCNIRLDKAFYDRLVRVTITPISGLIKSTSGSILTKDEIKDLCYDSCIERDNVPVKLKAFCRQFEYCTIKGYGYIYHRYIDNGNNTALPNLAAHGSISYEIHVPAMFGEGKLDIPLYSKVEMGQGTADKYRFNKLTFSTRDELAQIDVIRKPPEKGFSFRFETV